MSLGLERWAYAYGASRRVRALTYFVVSLVWGLLHLIGFVWWGVGAYYEEPGASEIGLKIDQLIAQNRNYFLTGDDSTGGGVGSLWSWWIFRFARSVSFWGWCLLTVFTLICLLVAIWTELRRAYASTKEKISARRTASQDLPNTPATTTPGRPASAAPTTPTTAPTGHPLTRWEFIRWEFLSNFVVELLEGLWTRRS